MVIGWLKRDDGGASLAKGSSAWDRIVETQRDPDLPCLLAPQPVHAVLAGDLAGALLAKSFGELPREIHEAIMMHDTGWAMLDAGQIQRLRSGSTQTNHALPISFVANSPRETVEAWIASINSVERLSPTGGLVVSRHFTLLASAGEVEYRQFVTAERTRQRRLETTSKARGDDLTRWTAALGFCDVVSLYLIAGLRGEVSFPLAHPASPQAQTAPRATMRFEGKGLRFTPQVFESGFRAELEALKHPVSEQSSRSEKLSWEFL